MTFPRHDSLTTITFPHHDSLVMIPSSRLHSLTTMTFPHHDSIVTITIPVGHATGDCSDGMFHQNSTVALMEHESWFSIPPLPGAMTAGGYRCLVEHLVAELGDDEAPELIQVPHRRARTLRPHLLCLRFSRSRASSLGALAHLFAVVWLCIWGSRTFNHPG